MAERLFRYRATVYEAAGASDTARVPVSGVTVLPLKLGATASAAWSFGVGGGTITVHDPGHIVAGDIILKEGDPTIAATVGSITATTIVCSSATGTFAGADGDRIIVTSNAPTSYTDDQGTDASGALSTDSNGEAEWYSHAAQVDIDLNDAGVHTVIAGLTGDLGNEVQRPEDWGAVRDDATDDSGEFADALEYIAAKGDGVLELGVGTYLLSSLITINAMSNLVIRGQGRGLTTIRGTAAGGIFDLTGACTDVRFENLTLQNDSTGDFIQLGSSCTRVDLINVHFFLNSQASGVGVDDNGCTDLRMWNCYFTGGTYTNFVNLNASTRPHLTSVVARHSGTVTAGVVVDTGCVGTKLHQVDISGAGVCLQIADSGAGTDPRGTIATSCRFEAGTSAVAVDMDAGESVILSDCEILDSQMAVQADGGDALLIANCISVGHQRHSFDLNASIGTVTIIGTLSSDISQETDNTYNHVDIAANVNSIAVIGCKFGSFIRDTGQRAATGILVASGTTTTCLFLANSFTTDVTDYISSGSTVDVNDYSHNIFGSTLIHSIPPMGDEFGTVELTGTEATQDARTLSSCEFTQSGAATFTNFTGGEKHQRILCYFNNGNTTLADVSTTGNFMLPTSADETPDAGDVYEFFYDGTNWQTISKTSN